MTKRSRRWSYVLVVLTGIIILLFLFRLELLFAFQRMRLNTLGCAYNERVRPVTQLDKLPPCEKLWAHRVNSLERFTYLKEYFSGLETDVVFDTAINNFRIYHPPAPPADLKVDAYFRQLKSLNKGLWMDVKAVDTATIIKAADFLTSCDQLYGIKKYVLIESSQIKFINLLAERGFTTSWLVPRMYLEREAPGQAINSIKQQLSPRVRFVSQEDTFLPYLKTRFSDKKIVTWALSFNNYFDLSHFKSLMADTSISVILINCKSKGHI